MVASIIAYSLSASSAKALKTHSQTPALDYREKRVYVVCQLPSSAGRSRHGAPVRPIHNTASTNKRLSGAADGEFHHGFSVCSGYPDCCPAFIDAFTRLARVATRAGVEGGQYTIHTPPMALGKDDIVRLGAELGVDYAQTVSCYRATDAGLACARCDACRLRREGFEKAGIEDVTRYVD